MLQDPITLKSRHQKFVKTVSESEIVYGLKGRKGFATWCVLATLIAKPHNYS